MENYLKQRPRDNMRKTDQPTQPDVLIVGYFLNQGAGRFL